MTNAPPPAPAVPLHFTDITAKAGIKFKHNNGAFGARWMPETTGGGVAFLDYDDDGFQDIFFVNSRDWTEEEIKAYQNRPWTQEELEHTRKKHKGLGLLRKPVREGRSGQPRGRSIGALYHNNRDGTFTDVTVGSGLDVEMYGMGAAVGDYDNDGKVDLYVTALRRNYLFRNLSTQSTAKFQDVARQAGVQDFGWSASAAWLDYDKDGRLDLFVSHYVKWSPVREVFQTGGGQEKIYGSPLVYDGQVSSLYRNIGAGRFQDVSKKAGIHQQQAPGAKTVQWLTGKAWGVAISDYNKDGWPDILVANDLWPNFLFENNKDGTFKEVGAAVGIALSEKGDSRAGMGIDAADIDHSDRESVVIGNFHGQMLGLYHNQGGAYIDIAPRSEVGKVSYNFLTWGLAFMDVDNDSWPDIITANGHVQDRVSSFDRNISYRQRPLLFRNLGRRQFQEIGVKSGLTKAVAGRGLAYADIDLDGDLDVVISATGENPLLLRNDGGNANNAIRLVLRGATSNRSAIGALVKVKLGATGLRRTVHSGSSFLSQSELPLTLGLGQASKADVIGIRWPSRKVTELKDVTANQTLIIDEDKGLVEQKPFAHRQ
ncbi:MAG TPA: CRTAC1 family protein [Abditibacteriaceae bacterium]|jgi:hypothetical protein